MSKVDGVYSLKSKYGCSMVKQTVQYHDPVLILAELARGLISALTLISYNKTEKVVLI